MSRSVEPSKPWSPWLRLLQLARWFVIRIPDPLRLHLAFRLRLPLGKASFVVTTKEGFRFVVWDLFEIVQRYVFWTGTWEHEEAIVVQQIPSGGTVVDVGAQLGYFSLSAAVAVGPSGKVIAVEPMPVNQARIRENLALNGFTNVTLVEVAAAGEAGTARFATRSSNHQTSWGGLSSDGDVEVTTRPLDDVLADQGVTKVDFLKIDVEGGEPDVIEGAQKLLESPDFKGPVLIEINELRLGERGHSGDSVIKSLTSKGFRDITLDLGLDPETGDRNLVFAR